MGKATRLLQQQMADLQAKYNQALSAVNTPSAAEQALTSEALGNDAWLKGGDYRAAPKGVFMSLVDPAQAQQQRALQMNSGAQGISALGGAGNATALGLAKMNMDDENANQTAANYQGQVSQLADKTAGVLGSLGSQDLNKRMSVLSNLGGMYQGATNAWAQSANKPGFWSQLALSGAGQAGALATKFL